MEFDLRHVLCCTRCGSLLDARPLLMLSHADHRCRGCPACEPGRAWRYGGVLQASLKAEQLREAAQDAASARNRA